MRKKLLPLTPEGAVWLCESMREMNGLLFLAEKYYIGIDHFLLNKHNGWTPLHTAAFQGCLDQVAQVLAPSGQNLEPEHFLYKDSSNWTVLHAAASTRHLDQAVSVLEASGHFLRSAHFLSKDKNGRTPLNYAATHRQLDQVFVPSHWIGSVGEMEKLWKQVPEKHRGTIDYASLREEAISLSVHRLGKIPAADFATARRSSGPLAGKTGPAQEPERN